MNFKKKILATIAASILSSAAWADNVLIIGGEGDSHVSVKTELEAAGHTVTYQAGSAGPTSLTGYQQVWDMRYNIALSANDMALYDTFLKNQGYLYLSGEHGGFAIRNNSISAFTSSLGGGTISVGGFAANGQTGNATYFTGGATVDYAAAAIITSAGGRTLSQDANGAATAKMWIGNAGDLGVDYNGTVIVVADINWTQGWSYDANNEDFLEQIIRGIVAGTVGGTISDNGVGAAGGGNSTPPPPPAPTTFSATNTNQVVVSDTMAAGTFTGNGGTLQAATGTTEISNNMVLNALGMTVDNNGQTLSLTGSVSGAGGWTFANTGSGGSTSLNGTYTYTGPTTINNGATVINNSNISSSNQLTNLGTLTNSATGRTGNWINGFNGDGNTAVLNNAGIMGNGTNYGTFNNSTGATVGTVSNVGTFNNAGNTGALSNMGTFNNNAGGTVSQLAYNNHIINNNGTITSVTYNGGIVNNNGTIGSINNEEAHGTFQNHGTVLGAVNTTSTFNNYSTGVVSGLYTNNGILNNVGTTNDWLNNSTVNNVGTMANGTNNGTFVNDGTVGTVNNTGTFTNTGTIGSLTNSGTFATNSITVGSYTQTGTGATTLPYGNVITSTGPATIDGTLTMVGNPYTTGKYNVLTGNGVSGTFSSYNGVGVLRYTPTGVQIWVMPDGTIVQANVNNLANNLSSMNSLATGSMINSLGSDCTLFGEKGGCIGVNYGQSKAGTGDLQTAGVTVAKRIDTNWRAGLFLGQQLNQTSVGAVKYESGNPAVGGFVGWNKNSDGTGLGITASAIQGRGNYDISGDNTGVKGEAAQIKTSYTLPINGTTSVAPYIGVRKSSFTVNGYTEQNELFPLTYSSTTQTSTDLLAGANLTKKLTDKITGTLSLGVIQQVDSSAGSLNSTSDMGNYSAPLMINKKTSASVGTGVSYAVTKNQRIGANVGVQQNQLGNISSVGVNYTVGF